MFHFPFLIALSFSVLFALLTVLSWLYLLLKQIWAQNSANYEIYNSNVKMNHTEHKGTNENN